MVEDKSAKRRQQKKQGYQRNKVKILATDKAKRKAAAEAAGCTYRPAAVRPGAKLATRLAQARREYRLALATPRWVSLEDILDKRHLAQTMQQIFKVAYHVDHIIPVFHKKVCGLHVPWNLQVISAEENLQKGSKWEPA